MIAIIGRGALKLVRLSLARDPLLCALLAISAAVTAATEREIVWLFLGSGVVGNCVPGTCNAGYGDCDGIAANGCEASILTNVSNCGQCGNICPAIANGSPGCSAGKCGIGMCNPLFGDCNNNPADGCEKDLSADSANCGTCGAKCTLHNATPICLKGQCSIASCNPGYFNCDGQLMNGCEVNLNLDANNCGACGTVCPANMPNCHSGSCTNALRQVLLVHGSPPYISDVTKYLVASNVFGAVDLFDATVATPTLAKRSGYDVILVMSDFVFQDPIALGNVVADYFDSGGRVVLASLPNAQNPLAGRFGVAANGYVLINPGVGESPTDSLGQLVEPMSPLLSGVTKLTAKIAARSGGLEINGGIVVARWMSGKPLIVRGVIKGRNRVDLNLYPPSNAIIAGSWIGDGALIVRNALQY